MVPIWINVHFTTVLLAVLCGIKFSSQKQTRYAELRFFWMTLISCFVLVIQDILESYCAKNPDLRFWRILLSILGYDLRPITALGLLLVVCPPEQRSWKLWIPAMINLAVNLTAFFSPLAFSFDQDYVFVRGPLGYVVFIVGVIYMIQTLFFIWKRFYGGKRAERWILICCVIGCLASSIVDALYGGCHLNEAILIGCIFLLFFLRSHDNYLEPLTSLRNRFAFYDDSENLARDISAIASLDMNGLKRLNDSKGHSAGDHALAEIGRCLNENSDRNTIPYRIGGDEFVILFMRQNKETVEQIIQRVKDAVTGAGYSVSVGYSMKEKDKNLDDALRESDQNMYKEKAVYYQKSGRDRRTRPRT